MKINTDNGKYTFVKEAGRIRILRHGEPWHEQSEAFNAIASLMAELDAARVVIAAVRSGVKDGNISTQSRVGVALDQHSRLVDDREMPSDWTVPHA